MADGKGEGGSGSNDNGYGLVFTILLILALLAHAKSDMEKIDGNTGSSSGYSEPEHNQYQHQNPHQGKHR